MFEKRSGQVALRQLCLSNTFWELIGIEYENYGIFTPMNVRGGHAS